ncbi:hypothetical protein OG301_39335 (plasmid) [Streptomyces platensis]|uniref:hypothetical protein n=1 Tax=Streptomyces platensis TaxID=58346 RepID=UPI002ED23F3E|nr:hypothetical protein OG301_39335 [Streptomyces platensis]
MYDRSFTARFARLERQVQQIAKGQRIAHGASLENAALEVNDDTGTLRAVIGVQPDGTTGVVAHNGPPPGAPSAPTVSASIAGLRVTWDGTLADGSALPADFDHIAVYVSQTSGFDPSTATFAGTITKAGDGGMLPVTPLPYAAHYVRLVGVNTSGIGGDPSAQTAGTPVQVDGPDLTAGSVTAGTIAAGAVEADKLEAILVLATRILAGSPSGARVELNSSGLRAYDAGGNLTVSIDGSTGAAAFTGDITGSDITGSTVTGGLLQTGSSGARTVVTPTPPLPLVQRPSVLMYSGVTAETIPAVFNSGANPSNTAQAQTVLSAPTTGVDTTGATQTPIFYMNSAKPGTYAPEFVLSTSNHITTSEIGYASIDALAGATTADTSSLTLKVKDGTGSGKQSTIYATGDHVTITANGSGHTFSSSGLSVAGAISARNTPAFIYKTTSTDRASTTTLADDPDLVGTFIAGETYLVELHLLVGAGTTGLMTTAWKVPSGATGLKAVHGPSSVAAGTDTLTNAADNITARMGSHAFTTTITYGRRNANSNLLYVIETGIVTMGATTGTFALQWTQSASSATATRMGVGSWVRFTRLSP